MIFLSNEAFPLVFGEGNNGHNWTQYVTGRLSSTFISAYIPCRTVRASSISLSWHMSSVASCESAACQKLRRPTHASIVNRGFLSQPLQEHAYHRISARLGYPSPEARWWSSLWATFFLPLGLFIAAWTSYSHIPFIAPLVSFQFHRCCSASRLT